mgnify:CR=1 FL=1
MYSDVVQKRRWLGPLCILAVLAVLIAFIVMRDPVRDISEESAVAIKEAVERTARQCYVVEGVYPPSLEYLEENYGLQVNKADFYVTYDAFASNLPPTVVVTGRKR